MQSTEKYFNIRKLLSWSAVNKKKKLWNSRIEVSLKGRIFSSTIEIIYTRGGEIGIITKSINGCYIILLRMV